MLLTCMVPALQAVAGESVGVCGELQHLAGNCQAKMHKVAKAELEELCLLGPSRSRTSHHT